MTLSDSLRRIEQRYATSLISLVIGTVIGVAGLYLTVRDRSPHLAFQLLSEYNALDINQSVADLSILYKGEDIQRSELNLRAMRIQVSNDGSADIVQSLYDVRNSWGLILRGGRVLEVKIVSASEDYLLREVNPRQVNDTVVEFAKVILEHGRSFTVDVLVMHPKSIAPSLFPYGKLAGVAMGTLATSRPADDERGIWDRLRDGSLGLHLVRLVVYPLAALGILLVAGFLAFGVGTSVERRSESRRAERLSALLEARTSEERAAKQLVVDMYAVHAEYGLVRLQEVLSDTSQLSRSVSRALRERRRAAARGEHSAADLRADEADIEHMRRELRHMVPGEPASFNTSALDDLIARKLLSLRLVTIDGKVARIHPAARALLASALDRLNIVVPAAVIEPTIE